MMTQIVHKNNVMNILCEKTVLCNFLQRNNKRKPFLWDKNNLRKYEIERRWIQSNTCSIIETRIVFAALKA